MSQLSNILKQVDQSVEKWKTLKASLIECSCFEGNAGSLSFINAKLLSLAQFHNEMELIMSSLQKFRSKLGQIDPVSGERRYGKLSQEKFEQANIRFHLVMEDFEASKGQIAAEYQRLELLEAHEHQKMETMDQKGQDHPVSYDETAARAQAEDLAKLQQDEEEMLLLHERAESIRRRKQEENLNLKRFEINFHSAIQQFLEDLHGKFGNLSRDKKLECLNFIKTHNDSKTRELITFISGILDRIIARPDNVNSRKLRLTQAVIQEKITSSPGCLQLLISFGFKPVLKCNSETVGDGHMDSRWCNSEATQKKLEAAFDLCTSRCGNLLKDGITDLSCIADILNPHSPFDITLEMEEPQVENLLLCAKPIDDKDAWLEWYDSLKMNANILVEFLHP